MGRSAVFVFLLSIGLVRAFRHNVRGFSLAYKSTRVAVTTDHRQAEVSTMVALFTDIFSNSSRTTSLTSVLGVESKIYDQLDNEIEIHHLDYCPVDLDAEVAVAINEITNVLSLPPQSEDKGPIHIVRGTGGGKSLALTMISIALASFTDILPLPVTFVCPGSTDDLQAITTLFPQRPDVGLALAVVSRMASAFYGLDRDEVVPRFYAHESALWKAMDGALSGKDVVAAFAIYLAQQAGVKKVVLLVDGYNHCNWELGLCYSSYLPLATDSVASCLGDAMLSFEFDQFGLSGALVLCGNTPAGAAFRTGKRILPVKLRDSLDPTSVVAKRFLVDIDVTDRSRHAVIPKLPLCGTSETSVALRVLEFIAAMYNGVPRGLECVHDELRRLVDRSATPRELVLTPEKVSTVLRNAMAKFREEYFRLPGAYIPPDHKYATLFGAPVPLDDWVCDGIGKSLWINSLGPGEFPTSAEHSPNIELRSSMVSLYATIPPETEYRTSAVEDAVRQLYGAMTGWPALLTCDNFHGLNRVLVDAAVNWICLKLLAAVYAEKLFLTVEELLQINSTQTEGGMMIEQYLTERIPLPPTGSMRIPVYGMRATLYTASGHPRKSAVKELDAIRLLEEAPYKVLQAAPLDTWDYGLLFLGAKCSDGSRPRRLLLFDNGARWDPQPEQEDGAHTLTGVQPLKVPSERAALGQQEHRENQRARQSRNFAKAAQLPQGDIPGGAGPCLNRGDYLYVCHSSNDVNSNTAAGNVIVVCARDTAKYFKFLFTPYKAMKALVAAVDAVRRTEVTLPKRKPVLTTKRPLGARRLQRNIASACS
jgi:hypothetical protein